MILGAVGRGGFASTMQVDSHVRILGRIMQLFYFRSIGKSLSCGSYSQSGVLWARTKSPVTLITSML